MECEVTRKSLVDFHFGTLSADERRGTRQHFLDCRECLLEFLELKESIEAGRQEKHFPSLAVRGRILFEAGRLIGGRGAGVRIREAGLWEKMRARPALAAMSLAAGLTVVASAVYFAQLRISAGTVPGPVSGIHSHENGSDAHAPAGQREGLNGRTIDSGMQTPRNLNVL